MPQNLSPVTSWRLAIAGVPGAGTLGFVALLLAISQIGGPLLILIRGGAACIGSTLIAILFTLVQAWRTAVSAQPAAEAMKPAA